MRPQADFAEVETLKLLFKHGGTAAPGCPGEQSSPAHFGPQHGATDDASGRSRVAIGMDRRWRLSPTQKLQFSLIATLKSTAPLKPIVEKILDRAGGLGTVYVVSLSGRFEFAPFVAKTRPMKQADAL